MEVLLTPERIILAAMTWNRRLGAWMGTTQWKQLDAPASTESLGGVVLELLDLSPGLKPETGGGTTLEIQRALGVRSQSALVKKARFVQVGRSGAGLLVRASERSGGGWVGEAEADATFIALADADARAVGVAVLAASDRSM